MLFLLWLDMGLVIDQLANREKPSFNPLSYSFFIVFILTLFPRITLIMRRLQDSGFSPKWALAPYSLIPLFIGFCIIATISAFIQLPATITPDADPVATMTAAAVAVSLLSSKELIWEVFFALGMLLQHVNLFDLLLDGIAMLSIPDASQTTGFTPITDTDSASEAAQTRLAFFALYGFVPLLTCSLWLIGILSPSQIGENGYGMAPKAGPGTRQNKSGHNPYAAYAHLASEKKERTADDVARDKAEVHALYKQRVLGQKGSE